MTTDRKLQVGDVVERSTSRRRFNRRGVVILGGDDVDRSLDLGWPPIMKGDYVIQHSEGSRTIGNDDGAWRVLSRDEWSHKEAVQHQMVMWEPLADSESATSSLEWAMVVALFSPETRREMEDGDWPTSIVEALEWLARDLDGEGHGSAVGSAT